MPRFAGERRFYPWLTVIASRLCIDSHRRIARTEPTAEVDLGGVEGGQQQIVDNVDLAYLAQALEHLGPRHREVLELRETHGWTYQQIADHYNVTMGTVEALLFRARKALKREFMAIAGDDHRLAALPFFGVAIRGLVAARARLHDLSSHALPVACAGAAGVAAVAGGLTLGAHPQATTPATTPHVVRVEAISSPAVGSAAPSANIAPTGAAVAPVLVPSDGAADAPVSVARGNAADGKARSENDPSGFKAGGITLGTDFAKATPLTIPGT